MDYARTSRWGAPLHPNCSAAVLTSPRAPSAVSTSQVEKIFMDSDDWKTAGVRIDMLKALARKCVPERVGELSASAHAHMALSTSTDGN